jgi:glucan phosphoethanolaminetransferase (alkaline phosphatase superfamily)
MIKKIKATDVKTPIWPGVQALGWLLAAVTLAAILLQIVYIVPLSEGIGQLIDIEASAATWLLGLLVFVEIFSLPFLLGLKVSPLMRLSSMLNSWIAAAVMAALAFSGCLEKGVYGELSTLKILDTSYSIWLSAVSVLFLVAVVIVSIGWWPLRPDKKKPVRKSGAKKPARKPAKKTKK